MKHKFTNELFFVIGWYSEFLFFGCLVKIVLLIF